MPSFATPSTFDPGPFLLALDGDEETFTAFGRDFLATFPGALACLSAAANGSNVESLGERSHALKGAVAIFHAHGVERELAAIETACRTQPDSNWQGLVAALAGPASAFAFELDFYCEHVSAGGPATLSIAERT